MWVIEQWGCACQWILHKCAIGATVASSHPSSALIPQGGSRTTSNIWFENISKYVDTLTLFFKNMNQRSLTPRWPLTPCLLRSHVWLYPRIIVSKSHGNTLMYVDTVINFAKLPYTTYIHTIMTGRVLRTRKQSGVRRILRVYKEHARIHNEYAFA